MLVLLLALLGGVYAFSTLDFSRTRTVAPRPLKASAAEADARLGAHLARVRGCVDCHGEDGSGQVVIDEPALAVLWSTNLTPGESGIGEYTERDWDRAVRHGVAPSGKALIFMPSHEFWTLSDEDLLALLAYYRSLPPMDAVRPEPRVGPLGRVLYLAGKLPLVPAELVDHAAERPPVPELAATASYGAYLATGCTGCHGPGLSGGRIPGGPPDWPAAANLTPDRETGIGDWSLTDFARALRKGIRPDGTTLDPAMPIGATRHLTDVEMEALYRYLESLEPRPFGNR